MVYPKRSRELKRGDMMRRAQQASPKTPFHDVSAKDLEDHDDGGSGGNGSGSSSNGGGDGDILPSLVQQAGLTILFGGFCCHQQLA